jgi:hypothetical protein
VRNLGRGYAPHDPRPFTEFILSAAEGFRVTIKRPVLKRAMPATYTGDTVPEEPI